MRRLWLIASVNLLLSCSTGAPPPTAPAPDGTTGVSTSAEATNGCGETALWRGEPPSWTATAAPPTFLRHALSREGNVAAFLFADPLRAPAPASGPSNKILWVVREPRNRRPLNAVARPRDAESPTVSFSFPADSAPGEIYPSIVDVPEPGCWRFTLEWDGNAATVDLPYVSTS